MYILDVTVNQLIKLTFNIYLFIDGHMGMNFLAVWSSEILKFSVSIQFIERRFSGLSFDSRIKMGRKSIAECNIPHWRNSVI